MAYDFVFIGGGLTSALSALAVLHRRPDAAVALVEREAVLGLGHTWCFHGRDVPAEAEGWLAPLVVQRWPGYSVRFPRRERRLSSAYACVAGDRLHHVVGERFAQHRRAALYLGTHAVEVSAHRVVLDDGCVLEAALVVDARGPRLGPQATGSGYQKFLGLELRVAPGHALTAPILMDATLPQRDGFRFMYALPFGERVLLEDTYFSESADLDEASAERDIWSYASRLGLQVQDLVRKERGVLPMPSAGVTPVVATSPVVAGYRGGYFHPATGYSFPLAVRFAEALARTDPQDLASSPLHALAHSHAAQLGFLFGLTRMMFSWFPPDKRFSVLEHFYRLPEPLIERFYAAELTRLDRARIFLGPPPRGISVKRALGFQQGATT